ncbi:hypothetical protein Leryth_024495 [Lithospermum erythrorhizon]|nr:hypothetical protein Leryth_024495 [Lithospermum erythrorhizon]
MHVAEVGEGPLVLFLHGFPELWYSWRHQMLFLADHGYRAVAPDLRGYGDTTCVDIGDLDKFTIHHLVGDIVHLLDTIALDHEKVFVVGHDWGAHIAWRLGLFRPDKVKALVNLSVPYFPRETNENIVEMLRAIHGDDYYVCRFQKPGDIEGELAKIDIKTVMKSFFNTFTAGTLYLRKGEGFGGAPDGLPPWLSDFDLDYFASKFERTGFTGGINYFRAIAKSWELTAPWTGAKIEVPAKFIWGDLGRAYHMIEVKYYIENGGFQRDVPKLEEIVLIKGAAHFIQQERVNEINKHIYDFIQKF